MEDTEHGKEWLVAHGGVQSGPFSRYELMVEAAKGKLHPRRDMVWKSGMEEWIPAGEVEGLFKRNDEAMAVEQAKSAFTEYEPELSAEEKKIIKGEWPGSGRGTYFFVTFIFPIIFGLGLGAFRLILRPNIDPSLLHILSFVSLLIVAMLALVVLVKRLQNIGMSRWWFFGTFVPILQIWVYYRVFACPPGYAVGKKLDRLGWFLAVIYWLVNLALVAVVTGIFYLLMNNPSKIEELRSSDQYKKFSEFMQEAQQRAAADRKLRNAN